MKREFSNRSSFVPFVTLRYFRGEVSRLNIKVPQIPAITCYISHFIITNLNKTYKQRCRTLLTRNNSRQVKDEAYPLLSQQARRRTLVQQLHLQPARQLPRVMNLLLKLR